MSWFTVLLKHEHILMAGIVDFNVWLHDDMVIECAADVCLQVNTTAHFVI